MCESWQKTWLGRWILWTGHPVDEDSLDNSYYGQEIWWDDRQQERDEELEIDGEDDVDLPLIEKVVNNY